MRERPRAHAPQTRSAKRGVRSASVEHLLCNVGTDVETVGSELVRLGVETQSYHAAADRGWLSLLQRDVTKWDYVRRLITEYGFAAALEAALAYTPHLRRLIDLRTRARAGLAAQDLLALGLSPSEVAALPQCQPLAPFASPLEALGWLYVAERSTQLHERVRDHVIARIPAAQHACAFLSASDGTATQRWLELGLVLERVVCTPTMANEVIAAARAAFKCMTAWSLGDFDLQARPA